MLGPHLVRLLVLGVEESGIAIILGWTRHLRSLSCVVLVHIDGVAGSDEVQSHLVESFALVESDLDPAFAGANTFQVVLVHRCIDHVLHVGHSSQRLRIEVLGQTFDVDVNYFLLGEVRLLVIFVRVVTGES